MTEIIDIAQGTAASVFDGTHSQTIGRGGIGAVLLMPGSVRLVGMPALPPVGVRYLSGSGSMDAEYLAAATTCDAVLRDMPEVRSLRLVGDCAGVIDAIEGRTAWRGPGLESLASLRAQGVVVSGRWIKSHMETADLPTRLNGIAHSLALQGLRGLGVDRTLPMQEGWLSLIEREPEFRPERSCFRQPITLAAAARLLETDPTGIAGMIGDGMITPIDTKKASLVRRLANSRRTAQAMNTVLVEWDGFARVYESLMNSRAAELLDTGGVPTFETVRNIKFA